jgi:protein cornichon
VLCCVPNAHRSLFQLVLPEYITHAVLTLIFLFSENWLVFFLNLPLAIYHVRR